MKFLITLSNSRILILNLGLRIIKAITSMIKGDLHFAMTNGMFHGTSCISPCKGGARACTGVARGPVPPPRPVRGA